MAARPLTLTPGMASTGAGIRAAVALVSLALLAGCAPTGRTSWTFSPGGSASPGASPSAAASGSPDASGPVSSGSPTAPAATSSPTATGYREVSRAQCPDSDFECVTLAVPRDHYGPADGPTWDVTYAIKRATVERRGTWVNITGGPGTSGISVADSYTSAYPTALPEYYDIVFIDQRGIGMSGPIQCVDAAAVYYRSTADPGDPADRGAVAEAARTFATDCVAEAGIEGADLPYYATVQAIEDLEAIRDHLGVEKLHLYGESYGTQFVQYYAARHPDRIATLFVDGPVDLTLGGIPYYVEAARSAEDTLVTTLRACTDDDVCAADVSGGDALAAYDTLRGRLEGAPAAFDFPTAAGTTERRELTATDLENAAFGYAYSPFDRSMFLRAVADASEGNLVPLARAAYDSVAIDPETLDAELDPTWSDAMYYAVECQDYAFYPGVGDAEARVDAWLADGAANGINDLRMGASFYGDMPCLYWPGAAPPLERPTPLVDTPYPVFVLTTTTDPATPIANGMRIFSRLENAYFFQTTGGPHIIFGWGEACPDEVIGAYLEAGTLPTTRVVTCAGSVSDAFVATAKPRAADYGTALELLTSLDDQIFYTNAYQYELADEPLTVGCDLGGTLTYTPTDAGVDVALRDCAFTSGAALSGAGSAADEAGAFEIDVTGEGDRLHYERDGEGATSVSGTYDGAPVELEG